MYTPISGQGSHRPHPLACSQTMEPDAKWPVDVICHGRQGHNYQTFIQGYGGTAQLTITLWESNGAMENSREMVALMGKSSINGGFPCHG